LLPCRPLLQNCVKLEVLYVLRPRNQTIIRVYRGLWSEAKETAECIMAYGVRPKKQLSISVP
jgi:hypothetical protein